MKHLKYPIVTGFSEVHKEISSKCTFCLDEMLPKGTILVECGKMLQRGAPKLGKDGKPMKDKHGKVIYEPYRIKVLNTINFKKSMHYNRATCSPLKRRRTALFQSVL